MTPSVTATNKGYEITPFKNTTCVKFSKCPNVSLINGNWNLLSYMDITEYNRDLDTLHENVENVENHCIKTNSTECRSSANEIFKRMSEIQTLDEVIKSRMKKPEKRSAFWYSLLGSTVGYLGEKVAEKIFGNSNDQANDIIKNQITILKKANREIVAMENERYLISYVLLSTLEFHHKQIEILKAITQERGKLTVDILTPNELLQQMEKISEKLPKNVRLIGDKPLDMYEFAQTRTWVTPKAFVTLTEVPLIDMKEYECVRTTPIPFFYEGQFIEPILSSKYMWFNGETMYLPSEMETNKCIRHEEKNYCETSEPLLFRKKANICEHDLYMNKSDSNCKYKTSEAKQWNRLAENVWMYSMENERTIRISCDQQVNEVQFNASGIIQLDDGCIIETDDYRIEAKKKITTNMMHKQIIQLHEAGSNIAHIDVPAELETLAERDDVLMLHHVHHYAAIYLTIVVTISIFYYFYIKLELAPEP